MFIFLTALFFFIFSSPVLAAPRICKFHPQDSTDWIEICNDSGTVDLSLYYVADLDQTNKKYLNCTFNTAINIPLSDILNDTGDTISLIEISSGNSVSTVRYCDSSKSTCPPDSDVVDIKDSLCGLINPDDTRSVSRDAAICLPLPATCPVSSTPPSPTSTSPSPSPTASPSPTPVPTKTPTPTSSPSPSPTLTPSPSPTQTPQPTQYSQSAVLAATDTNFSPTATPTPTSPTRLKINVPVMLIILGSLLLFTPLAISKFPHAKI